MPANATEDLHEALRHAVAAVAAVAETDPSELDAGDRELFRLCEDRIEQIIETLVTRHDEAGPAARAILRRFRLFG